MNLRATLSPLPAIALILASCSQPAPEPPPATEAAKQEAEAAAKTETKEDRTPGEVVADGVFMGHSGKPMAGARLFLSEVTGDYQFRFADLKLVGGVQTARVDDEGRFQFKGFTPGTYTIVYQPRGVTGVVPVEIPIKTLSATTDSITPLLRNFEIGTDRPFSEREWGRRFTLLKNHTMYSEGPKMKIWNATVRYGQRGPYLEMRRGMLWTEQFEDNSEIKFEAWSF